ncbi:bi-domain-containing oxidoreductase [Thalassotalea hakodatensis]|uniref:bi-domain-containing oxidoreductase n=1 Tax=Thalassotalea hakodatensis TaxID=3030492 RepID=UPI002572FEA6|nr:bi-domain-containing oxidoreductase [Thalassotalea hakodatensis]
MKQILQHMGNGETSIIEAPEPQNKAGHLVIESSVSLISVGTERMLVDFGKASLIDKARQQPDKVKMVLDKIQTDGVFTTLDAVKSKLAQPLPLGYCHVGNVKSVGDNISNFAIGDRVVSNGPHADVVRVAKHLSAKIPDNVDDESAAFTVLASIGLQGIRLVKPTLGEHIVVIGAGLIGLLTIQLLMANGCRVLAVDFDNEKLALAQQFGAEICNPSAGEDPVSSGLAFSRQQGVDAVIITASTSSSDPVSQAANMSRKRGRIVLVGVTGLTLNRSEFYEKELSFQVSCSYGPGRYDDNYESQGQDYPIGFVRWTEQRNFTAILDMMSLGKLNVKPLISHRYLFDKALDAYQELSENKSALGILLTYPTVENSPPITHLTLNSPSATKSSVTMGFIGAGNYASRVLIPAFKAADACLHSLATSTGINSVIHGKNNGFLQATTDTDAMLNDETINTVAIVTQHNSHAGFINKALDNKKHVFVEKPLAINQSQHDSVISQYKKSEKQLLMVGFNRRFAPQIIKMKQLLSGISAPKSFIITVNAGVIPVNHWTQNPEVGGGRILGEACHFIDLMRHLASSKIVSIQAHKMGNDTAVAVCDDKVAIILGFEDGSFGTIHYLANGSASFPKERIEVFVEGKVLQLDNFRKLTGYGFKGFKKMHLWQQDKGQKACAKAFVDAIENGKPSPIPADELFEVSQATLDVVHLLENKNK